MKQSQSTHIQSALNTLQIEQKALELLASELDERFDKAIELILKCTGRVVITGMGKSGLVGRKIAATLASTGTPSFFMHPGEAVHGDLGMVIPGDVVIAISNSGASDEILMLIPTIQYHAIPLITISRSLQGKMPSYANVALTLGAAEEACPLQLAPTSSTTSTMALGDALAVALMQARGFTRDDFARSHPAGALGRRLLVYVRDVMHTDDALPKVLSGTPIKTALLEMTGKRLGMTAIVDTNDRLLGIFTDGDLRRSFDNPTAYHQPIDELMTPNPTTIGHDKLAFDALNLMNDKNINQLLVVGADNQLLGALTLHDLLKAGIS